MWRLSVCHVFSTAAGENNDILIRISHHSGAVGQRPGGIGRRVVMMMMVLASDSCRILNTLFRTCNSQVIKHPYYQAETPYT